MLDLTLHRFQQSRPRFHPIMAHVHEMKYFRAREKILNNLTTEEQLIFKDNERFLMEHGGYERTIWLRVYQAHNFFNDNILTSCGLGIYHTGIYVPDFLDDTRMPEITFGPTGIFSHDCNRLDNGYTHTLIKEIPMGTITIGRTEIATRLEDLREIFAPGTYKLVGKNCHTFCKAFLMALDISKDLPAHYTRAGRWTNGPHSWLSAVSDLWTIPEQENIRMICL